MISNIIAIGGAVGVGKSSVALLLRDRLTQCLRLEQDLGRSLRLLRSDVLRKRLLDIDPMSRLPSRYYENEQYHHLVYDTLHQVARIAAGAGDLVLLDATYTRRWQRISLEAIVGADGFQGFWLEASIDERLKRLTGRSNDPSDAGADFAAEQHIERPADEVQWECIDVGRVSLEGVADRLSARICGSRPA